MSSLVSLVFVIMPRNLNIQEKAAIIDQYENGYTIREISRNLNLTRNTVRFWIRRYAEEGQLIDHGHNSVDINPIENLWGLMVQRWENRNERIKLAIENHCQMIWEEMRGTDLCSRLVGSMRNRLQSVIDARSGYISY